ncbi:MAG TPA: N-6 DNA methylase [Candidatus Cloacimonadota bacterium]|nr:N-6 DNA methylase [Candidatus Cloacimonadota bacterium]
MSKRSSIFSTVRTEGAILPPELLMRLINGDSTLDGVKPQDYHLSPSERLNEAATRAYNRLTGVWTAFKETMAKLPEDAIGTTETRERWLLPLFQELGYGRLQIQKALEIEGKSYPISHQATEPVAIHLISCKWDLDKRNPIAKSETKQSPHSLMQEFLNRSPDHLWGFLSNGYKLRILRDNVSLTRAAYVEFDLQAMLDNEAYSDFFLLYLLCHQSRVEVKTDESGRKLAPQTCWLERWYNTSLTEGVRALDELRDSVQNAIESLGAGFLIYPANAGLREKLTSGSLSVHAYYSQVLRQVYRLLLIFVSEDRDLLIPADVSPETKDIYHKYYSTYRIRELAQRKRGTRHTDLWLQLNLLFNSLHTGNPALGLPALGSYLFRAESTPDLADCLISNSYLLAAFRSLCYTQKNNVFQPINYRNLGPEELGSVYESLLEMSPEVDLAAGYFKLSIISGSERKTTGSYYTPTSLVNCLLDSALEPDIDNALHSPQTSTILPEEALLALKICDPACGSGHFLIAAAHRIAKRLASIRAGEDEPAPSVIQHALRDVIGHCIYGVDLNPMAVELCKISLWMEALEPGKPLTFLDHHIQCGNSLLGCTPSLLKQGIPDAAFTPLTGDDKDYCNRFRRQNREERDLEVLDIFSADNQVWSNSLPYAPQLLILDQMADPDLESLVQKEQTFAQIQASDDYQHPKFIFDAWCASFVIGKSSAADTPYPITQRILDNIQSNPANIDPVLKAEIQNLADKYRFFHWHLAFPEVFSPPVLISSQSLPKQQPRQPGFDCVLGNPPWERVKLQEKEFFSARDADIANAPNAAARKRLIEALPQTDPLLYQAFLAEKRIAEGSSLLIREGGRYPLCGRGDVNTYTVFAELNRILLSDKGRCGCIVPSGIATDDTTKFFFQDLIDTGSLVSLYDFENREGLFPAVDSRMKFCLLTLRTPSTQLTAYQLSLTDFVFFAHQIADLSDEQRHFQLSAQDIALINPNTRTCPIFRSKADAELTKYIYRRVPVLINENDPENGNPWGISFMRMFDMSNDSHLFKTREQLEDMGYELQGNHFVRGDERWLPLYEGKMVQNYDHRAADVRISEDALQRKGQPEQISLQDHKDPFRLAMPSSWISEKETKQALGSFNNKKWYLGFSSVTSPTNARSFVPCLIPESGVGNSFPVMLQEYSDAKSISKLYSCTSSYILDYTARQKIGGVNLNFFLVNQFPVIDVGLVEALFDSKLSDLSCFLLERVLELSYTAWDLQSFALDCGYDGPPFIWDEERRFEIKCELDALFFHLYLGTQSDWEASPTPKPLMADGLQQPQARSAATIKGDTASHTAHHSQLNQYFPTARHAVEYIMETFPIVKRKDEKEYEEYRTKRRILEIYDQMTHCLATGTEYRSTLNPPPGPPCDKDGNFISVEQWDKNKWPKHIHRLK